MSLLNKLKEKFGQTEPLRDRIAQAVNKSNDGFFANAKGAAAATATRAATRIPIVGAAAIPAAKALDEAREEPIVQDDQAQREIATQIDLNQRMGYRTNDMSNIVGVMTIEEFKTQFPDNEVPKMVLDNPEQERKEVRIKTDSKKEEVVNDKVIDNLLKGEGLNSTPDQLAAAFEREGAVGPGQHRQIFYDQWNPIFKKEFGRDYDRENLEDVKVVTKLALEKYVKKFGSLEGALIAYNKGESVTQQYVDDPNYTFDDDPYVKGFKERMDS